MNSRIQTHELMPLLCVVLGCFFAAQSHGYPRMTRMDASHQPFGRQIHRWYQVAWQDWALAASFTRQAHLTLDGSGHTPIRPFVPGRHSANTQQIETSFRATAEKGFSSLSCVVAIASNHIMGRFGAEIRYQVLVHWCRVLLPYLALRRIGRIQSQVPLRPVDACEYKSSKLSCRMKQPYPIPASFQYPNRAKRLVLILLIHPIAL